MCTAAVCTSRRRQNKTFIHLECNVAASRPWTGNVAAETTLLAVNVCACVRAVVQCLFESTVLYRIRATSALSWRCDIIILSIFSDKATLLLYYYLSCYYYSRTQSDIEQPLPHQLIAVSYVEPTLFTLRVLRLVTVPYRSSRNVDDMASNEEKAMALLAEAEKKLNPSKGFFSSLFGWVVVVFCFPNHALLVRVMAARNHPVFGRVG